MKNPALLEETEGPRGYVIKVLKVCDRTNNAAEFSEWEMNMAPCSSLLSILGMFSSIELFLPLTVSLLTSSVIMLCSEGMNIN